MRLRRQKLVLEGYGEWKREYDLLAAYNAETSRGVAHTPDWIERMAEAQRDFDENYLPQQ